MIYNISKNFSLFISVYDSRNPFKSPSQESKEAKSFLLSSPPHTHALFKVLNPNWEKEEKSQKPYLVGTYTNVFLLFGCSNWTFLS